MLGGIAGIAGCLWAASLHPVAIVLIAASAGLVVAAYVATSRVSLGATTEVAALVVLAAGVLAGTGHITFASGVIVITTLLLVEKSWLHGLITEIDDQSLRAGVRFAVMAVVILPLLPEGPFGPYGGVRPRQLWLLVLLFSGLSFVGYIARRVAGPGRGYSFAGLVGGLVSSTAVAFTFARLSRKESNYSYALAMGVVAACTMLNLRVLVAAAVLRSALVPALVPYLAGPFLVGAVIVAFGWKHREEGGEVVEVSRNPLQVASALQMAVVFQVVLYAVYFVRGHWGQSGLLWSGAVLGLTDLDALTLSMAKSADQVPHHDRRASHCGGCVVEYSAEIGAGRFDRSIPLPEAGAGVADGDGGSVGGGAGGGAVRRARTPVAP